MKPKVVGYKVFSSGIQPAQHTRKTVKTGVRFAQRMHGFSTLQVASHSAVPRAIEDT